MKPSLQTCLRRTWGVIRSVLFIINNLYAIPVYLVWMAVLAPLAWLAPAIYWWFEGYLFHSLVTMAGVLSYTAGYQMIEMGDSIEGLELERCLLLVNHQSTADVPIMMTMMAPRRAAADNVYWIMDSMFKWTHFGMVSQCRGDFFVECGREKRDKSVEELRGHLAKHYLSLNRKWLILFPEGGFLWKRRKASQRFAEKQGLPHLEHVTLPRMGAAGAVLQQLGDSAASQARTHSNGHGDGQSVPSGLRWVIDVTIAYPEAGRPLHLLSLMAQWRPPCAIYIYYRVYPVDQVPTEPKQLTTWLYDLFITKNAALDEYYRTGQFPAIPGGGGAGCGPPPPPRLLRQDMLDYLLRELFFLASAALQLRAGALLWGWLMSVL